MMPRALTVLAALSVVALPSTQAHAYRTLADDPELASEAPPPRWSAPSFEFDVYANLSSPTPAYVEQAAVDGMGAWQAPECSAVRGVSRGIAAAPAAPEDGRNTIMVVTTGWDDLGVPDTVGATTDVQLVRRSDGGWEIVEADIYVDWVGHPWDRGEAREGGLDGDIVLRHEIGHALGLMHPCEFVADAGPMCGDDDRASGLYPEYLDVAELSEDDVAGVCALYPALSCADGCPAHSRCEDGRCVGTPQSCEADGADAGCSSSCATDRQCSGVYVCAIEGSRAAQCAPAGSEGTRCGSADDCVSALCLAEAPTVPYCTEPCESDQDCDEWASCTDVDGTRVCARAVAPTCSVSAARTQIPMPAIVVFVTLGLWLRARRREVV